MLNQEALKPIIDVITQEVMKRLQDFIKEKEKPAETGKESILLVFTGGTGNLDNILTQLKSLSGKYRFNALFSHAAQKAVGRDRVRKDIEFEDVPEEDLHTALAKTDIIVFPTLTQNTAAKGALGIRDSCASEALACGLLLKKRVIAVNDSISLRCMPAAYGRMVGEILKRLEQLGVILCNGDGLRGEILKKAAEKEQKSADKPEDKSIANVTADTISPRTFVLEGKGPVTSEVIFKAVVEGYDKLILAPKTLVTPMAKDTAKEKNITLEWAVK